MNPTRFKQGRDAGSQAAWHWLVFNKLSGALVGMVGGGDASFAPQSVYFNYKKLRFNPRTHIWQGDFASGNLVAADAATTPVYEAGVDNKAMDKIRGKFDYYKQLNVLMDVVEELMAGAVSNPVSTPAKARFNEVKKFIKETRTINTRLKSAYQDSDAHEFVSKADADTRVADQLEGGIHELLGPRTGRGQSDA